MDAYRPFAVRVARVERLSSTFRRVTLAGECLSGFDSHGFDQRINLLFLADGHDAVAGAADWTAAWRCGPPSRWAPLRTYTVRAFRPSARELDVDFALHGDAGPASRWAGAARPGDRVVLIGATPGHPISDVAWSPPPTARQLLLAADETALPAAAAIAEQHTGAGLTLVLEVPAEDDRLPMPGHVKTIWRVRSRGDRMEPVIRELLAAGDGRSCAEQMPADDIWEVPEQAANSSRYAWLAGESGTVTSLRRHLVGERGMDRRAIAFMGYWRRRAVAA